MSPINFPIYPAGLVVAGRRCLVVGGGKVAARKIATLLAAGAKVTVVAPQADEALATLTKSGAIAEIDGNPLDVQLRRYRPGEAADYRLVIASTGNRAVDAEVHRDAESAGVWVNCADDAEHCTFVLPAVARYGPVTVAVSTAGNSPALASWLRSRIAEQMGDEIAQVAELFSDARQRLHDRSTSTEGVDFKALLDAGIVDLVKNGEIEGARTMIDAAVDAAVEEAPR